MRLNTERFLDARGYSIVLVGLMGAGKTAIGKRLAIRLGLPFYDADHEIERAAGITIAEIFERHGEAHFRAGEKRVIQRLLNLGPIVLAPGGGAFMDPDTRALIHQRAISVWLHSSLPVLLNRVRGRTHRPLLNCGDPAETLRKLLEDRNPVYAEADIVVHSQEDPPEVTTETVFNAIVTHIPPRQVNVRLSQVSYDVLIGTNLLNRAGHLMLPQMPRKRCVIVTDATVAAFHLAALQRSLTGSSISHDTIIVPAGEASKCIDTWNSVVEGLFAHTVDRQTTIVALGGGVIGDLAGFAAAVTLRGLPLMQIPTTLLAQVDSSVGGKTGINSPFGKNLIGAFHQPRLVLADISVLSTLPARDRRAGYAEILKAGVVADAALYEWCEVNAERLLEGDASCLADAVERAVLFKAGVVAGDEREEKINDGRALLNFGHTFGHALEAETGYNDSLLHGEAVAIGIALAMQLSANLGFCGQDDARRVGDHLARVGLPTRINNLLAGNLLAHMKRDKKNRDGKLTFVLARGIGKGFTNPDVPEEEVRAVLLSGGAV